MPATADGKPPRAKQVRSNANAGKTFTRRTPPAYSPPSGSRSDAAQRSGANTPRPQPAPAKPTYSPRLRSDAAQRTGANTPVRKPKPARRKAPAKSPTSRPPSGEFKKMLQKLNGKVLQVFPKCKSKAKVKCPKTDADNPFKSPFLDIIPSRFDYAEATERARHRSNQHYAKPLDPDAQRRQEEEVARYRRILGEDDPMVNAAYGEDLGRSAEEDPNETVRFLLEQLRTVSKTPEGRKKAEVLRRKLREAREMLDRQGNNSPPRPSPRRRPPPSR